MKSVSVIIPTYNYGRFIANAIESCIDQTHPKVEIIVIDDGSTDDTRSIVDRFGDRVVYHYQINQGVSSARNAGLDRAAGDFVCFLDADDYFVPDAIEAMVDALSSRKNVGMVIGRSYSKAESSSEMRLHNGWNRNRAVKRPYRDVLLGRLSVTSPPASRRTGTAFQISHRYHERRRYRVLCQDSLLIRCIPSCQTCSCNSPAP